MVAIVSACFAACSHKQTSIEAAAASTGRPDNDRQNPSPATRLTTVQRALSAAEHSLKAGSLEDASAQLLRVTAQGRRFSYQEAAAYRQALSEAYSRSLEAANKGDTRGKAARQMIRGPGSQ